MKNITIDTIFAAPANFDLVFSDMSEPNTYSNSNIRHAWTGKVFELDNGKRGKCVGTIIMDLHTDQLHKVEYEFQKYSDYSVYSESLNYLPYNFDIFDVFEHLKNKGFNIFFKPSYSLLSATSATHFIRENCGRERLGFKRLAEFQLTQSVICW